MVTITGAFCNCFLTIAVLGIRGRCERALMQLHEDAKRALRDEIVSEYEQKMYELSVEYDAKMREIWYGDYFFFASDFLCSAGHSVLPHAWVFSLDARVVQKRSIFEIVMGYPPQTFHFVQKRHM